jgi:predicted ribosome-associated RNA-binding protein Tma20/translation initiation factor 1 (eIF-1/SUI1)
MFKNTITTTQSYLMSKKEKKDLSKKLNLVYDIDAITYIINKFHELYIFKTNLKKRIITYQGDPIFFEMDNDLFYPTVYLLNYFPNLMKKICIIYDETDNYLENGADLMLKGVLNREQIKKDNFRLNDIFSVIIVSGIVTSLGETVVSGTTMNIQNPSGKFLRIIHRFNDQLWNFGTKKIPKPIEIQTNNTYINNYDNTDNIVKEDELENKIDQELIISEISEEKKEIEEDVKEEIISYSKEDIDKNIDIVFLTTIKLIIKPDMLPLDPGKLYKDYLKPVAEELDLNIDFKLSSYKKLSNYMKYLHKEKSIINYGKPKNIQNEFILSINWYNSFFSEFKPTINKIKNLQSENKKTEERENILLQNNEKIEITQLFKPNQNIKNIFEKTDPYFSNRDFYLLKECQEVLVNYLKNNDLFIKGTNDITMNDDLSKSLIRKNEDKFQTCRFDEILKRWKSNLNEKDLITKTNNGEVSEILSKGKEIKVKIYGKKVNNKNATIVEGLENFINVKEAIKTFSKHFACSVTMKDFKELKNIIFIQGYWVNELQDILLNEIKLNKNFIVIDDKLKLKNRK